MNWQLVKQRLNDKVRPKKALQEYMKNYSGQTASVLIALFSYDDDVYVLMTQRSANLKFQPNDVCFPGGKKDETDESFIDTALRETYEEIGLHPSHIDVLCELVPLFTVSQIMVVPVVAVIANLNEVTLQINADEVADVFACPLSLFLTDPNHSCRYVKVGGKRVLSHSFLWSKNAALYNSNKENTFCKRVLADLHHEKFSIWGITGLIGLLVATATLDRPAVFDRQSYTVDDVLETQKQLSTNVFRAKL